MWIDSQTPTSYTNWYPGEPNDYGGTPEKCIVLNNENLKGWHDVPCTSMMLVVCERDS